ncbi:ISC system 2Fe-2S type ferredoxin [Methyloradius palustris]|uniref:2Fe-2S ferredoxin n=1 Tax=Methyloradius palustris TaxID=2778876 RepID=A0A8D5G472_9PROT|nr:ISC system 2Fe-2S type ferredoxin [Methyloradius palustris]BCM25673.1 (2Fe-2S) ferredoxin [Methyloradius palustris]
MPTITVLPHPELCPEGASFEAKTDRSICENLLEQHIDIDHACDRVCACTTCHIVVTQGYNSLNPAEENEEDLLDQAWGLKPTSRLSCQAKVEKEDVVIEIPRYSINMAKEGHR